MEMDFEKELVEIENRVAELKNLNKDSDVNFDTEITDLELKLLDAKRKAYAGLTPWESVQVARHPDRPILQDYIAGMFDEFIELHGDRSCADDRAMICGFARIGQQRMMLIGTEKGKSVDEKVVSNFGMANPEGYRKALRLMQLAEKYRLPVLCLVDTPAAYPGREAEERGQAEAIARNLTRMATLETPIVVVVTGEGGSGGALGIGVGDTVLMLSHSIYSVIPPEGCAAILWRDAEKAPEAATALKLTAKSLVELGIVDEVIAEPVGGAHRDHGATISAVKKAILEHVSRLQRLSVKKLLDKRFEKYVKIGKFDNRKYAVH
ncbi:acetyl-CoA carboxylase carboxyltransferase subunit alpha [Verrucomicrobiota bacterium]